MINTIDTFKTFKEVFKDKLDISIDDKIKLWEYEYMIHYPELLVKCKDYPTKNGYQWKKIASEIVFNKTKDNFEKMIEAYSNIKKRYRLYK